MFEINELLKVTAAKLLAGNKNSRVTGISIDSRTIKPQEAFIAIKGHNFDGHNFINEALRKGASCVILRKGRALGLPRQVACLKVSDTLEALGSIACYHRKRFDIPLIAVTGTNGKTTTKEMLASVLSVKFNVLKNEGTKNNQIGLPLALLGLNKTHGLAVLEIGTNRPGEVERLARIASPNMGIITNIGPSHLEFLCDLENVSKEKYSLITNLASPYIALLNSDDDSLRGRVLKKTLKPFTLSFGIKNKADFMAAGIRLKNKKTEFTLNNKSKCVLDTLGYCNVYNALCSIAAGRIFGIEYGDMLPKLAAFSFPQGRLRLLELNKVKFIDDTYNSNPLSLKHALEALSNFDNKGRKIFIMGDMLELGAQGEPFHHEVGRRIRDVCDVFIAVGKLSGLAAQIARKSGFDIGNIYVCDSSSAAQKILFSKITPCADDVVLVKGSRSMRMERVFRD